MNIDAVRAVRAMAGSKVVAYHTIYAKITKSATAGILLSQFCFWGENTPQSDDGWFQRTQKEIQDHTFLTREEQDTAKRKIVNLGLVEIKKKGLPLKTFYRINFERLTELILATQTSMWESHILEESKVYEKEKPTNSPATPDSIGLRESHILDCGIPTNRNAGFPHTTIRDFLSLSSVCDEVKKPEEIPDENSVAVVAKKASEILKQKNIHGAPEPADPVLCAHIESGLTLDEIIAGADWCLHHATNSFGYLIARITRRREDAAKIKKLPPKPVHVSAPIAPAHPSHIEAPKPNPTPRSIPPENLFETLKKTILAPVSSACIDA